VFKGEERSAIAVGCEELAGSKVMLGRVCDTTADAIAEPGANVHGVLLELDTGNVAGDPRKGILRLGGGGDFIGIRPGGLIGGRIERHIFVVGLKLKLASIPLPLAPSTQYVLEVIPKLCGWLKPMGLINGPGDIPYIAAAPVAVVVEFAHQSRLLDDDGDMMRNIWRKLHTRIYPPVWKSVAVGILGADVQKVVPGVGCDAVGDWRDECSAFVGLNERVKVRRRVIFPSGLNLSSISHLSSPAHYKLSPLTERGRDLGMAGNGRDHIFAITVITAIVEIADVTV
jgi:hypothetical protein